MPEPRVRKPKRGGETPEQKAKAKVVSGRVAKLKAPQIREILARAAQMHPDVMAMLDEPVPGNARQEPRILNFEAQAQKVWDWMDKDYKSGGLSKAFKITDDIAAIIQSIAKQCGPDADPETRLNGLFSLCQIVQAIAATFDCKVRHQIRNQFDDGNGLPEAMYSIIKLMGDNEIRLIATQSDGNKLLSLIQEVSNEAIGYCIFEGLRSVVGLLIKRIRVCGNAGSQEEGEGETGNDTGREASIL